MKTYFLLLFLLLSSTRSFSQTKSFIDQPYLETTAKVDTLVSPDLIYLSILISEKDERNKVSVEDLEKKMIKKLKSLNIDIEKQLTLSDINSDFKRYLLRQKDIMKEKSYLLKVFDSQTAAKVLLGMEEVGISNVGIHKTEFSKMDELQMELKSKAVQKAMLQANYLVKPLNQKVGRALHIMDSYRNYYPNSRMEDVVMMTMSKGAQEDAYVPPSIEFKPIRVEAEVSIKFAME